MSESTEDIKNAMNTYFKKRVEMFDLLAYPPFSTIPDGVEPESFLPQTHSSIGHRFYEALLKEEKRINRLAQDAFDKDSMASSIFSRPFSTVAIEFEDEIAEAKLYQKRYADVHEAARAELQIRKK